MISEQTVKCPICGKPYVTFAHYAGDQSACPSCRSEARGGNDYNIIVTDNTNSIKKEL